MNADRRAALQRKLAVVPVPKPPAGLAAKIKNDIPKELRFSAERERARLVQSVRLSIAVAASVIVVIATAYLALQVTSTTSVDRTVRPAVTATSAPIPVLQEPAALPPAAAAPKIAPQRKEERKLAQHRAKRQAIPPPSEAPAAPASVAAPAAEAITVNAAADRAMTKSIVTQSAQSPISGNVMGDAGAPVVPWKDASRETKIKILKEELARGADPKEVARVAREAGLDAFADSVEKH